MAADKMPVVMHLLYKLGALFDLAAHEEEAGLYIALTKSVKEQLRILAGTVVKCESYLLFESDTCCAL